MQTAHSTARHLASSVTSSILEALLFDDKFIQELPRKVITRITGKRCKPFYNECPHKKLEHIQHSLALAQSAPLPDIPFEKNLQLITSTLQLPKHCIPVIRFCVLTTLNVGLNTLLDEYLFHLVDDFEEIVADVLNISVDELTDAIRLLSTSSVFEQDSPFLLGLLIMPETLASNLLFHPASKYSDLLVGMHHQTTPTTLTVRDYPHLELRYVSEYLKQAVKVKTAGVNILLHGVAGTGKTELSKVLSQYIKRPLVAIKAVGESQYQTHDEITSSDNVAHLRLQHYRLMQHLFNVEKSCCLLLDEVEDVFTEYLNGVKVSKDRLHEVLETNTLPCFWITNHVEMLPDSVIRRMSYVIEVPPPPKHIKAHILSKPLKGLRLSREYKNSLASIPDLTPAHVVSASTVARTLQLTATKAEQCINHHIEQCLSACGLATSVIGYQAEMFFDPRFIQLTGSHTKIGDVIDTVTHFTGSRCLLLGAAGTGKSAFVHHLSEVLAQELITIKPSDVLSKYVGEAEQNIAQLFKQASECDAIIFLDEVDSVLTSRSALNNQHERVLVNEILLQLDRCEQTVFAASNLAQNLDDALLRRFDFKLNFQYLTSAQVLTLYEESFGSFSTSIREKLKQLHCLTPGDFAVAVRRNRMSKKPLSDSNNLDILTVENNRKTPSNAIGFVK